ncbi:hypothetical protein Dimus_033889 [Dionaea muscipula]
MVLEAFNVPLIDKKGEEPKRYDFFEETFLTMCQLKRENEIRWLGTGKHVRRDDEIDAPTANEEVNEEEHEVQESAEVSEEVPYVPAPASVQQKEKAPTGVDPSGLTGSIPDSVFMTLQAELEKARADRIQDDLEKV